MLKALPIPDAAFYIRNKASNKVLQLEDNGAVLLRDKSNEDSDSQMAGRSHILS
jgi:hypothetical protein